MDLDAPANVRTASRLLWLLAVLAVVRTALVLLDDGSDGAVGAILVGLVLVGGLLSICAYLVARGVRWARGLATLIASLAAIGGFSSVLDASSAVFLALGAVGFAAAAGAIVLMFSAPARPYFRRRRTRPRTRR